MDRRIQPALRNPLCGFQDSGTHAQAQRGMVSAGDREQCGSLAMLSASASRTFAWPPEPWHRMKWSDLMTIGLQHPGRFFKWLVCVFFVLMGLQVSQAQSQNGEDQ